MRMRRLHAIQVAREIQRAENQKKREPVKKPKKKSFIKRLVGI